MKTFKIIIATLLMSTALYAQDSTKIEKKRRSLLALDALGVFYHANLTYERQNDSRFAFALAGDYSYVGYNGWKVEPALRVYLGKKERKSTYLQIKNGIGRYEATYYNYGKPEIGLVDERTFNLFVIGVGVGTGKRFFLNQRQSLVLDLYSGVQFYPHPISPDYIKEAKIEFYGSKVDAYNTWLLFSPGAILDLKVSLGWRF